VNLDQDEKYKQGSEEDVESEPNWIDPKDFKK
jgi:hypothetical protein